MLKNLSFEIRWNFRTDLYDDLDTPILTRELPNGKEYSKLVSFNKLAEMAEKERGISPTNPEFGGKNLPFSWKGSLKRPVENVSKCERTYAEVRMFLKIGQNGIFSNFSDMLSFDAPSEPPMLKPEIEALMFNANEQYLKVCFSFSFTIK